MQYITAYASYQYQRNISTTHINYPINNTYDISEKSILIRSDTIKINYPKNIQFDGNVNIKSNNHALISDQLIISYNNKKNLLYTICANGNINYNNNNITLTGQQAWINLNNNNINIYEGTYYLKKSYIHGSANTIMQRENNRYTIIKHGNITSCLNENYWNITGSNIIYDNIKNSIDIWNAHFKINKIPIFYSPYLFLSLNKNNTSTSYIPNIKYSNKYGLILKIPCPIYSSKYFSGNISSYYISNIGIKLQTKINYSIHPCSGLIIFNIIKNNKINQSIPFNENYRETSGNIYWRNNSIIHKKWYFNAHYTSKNYSHYLNNTNSNYVTTRNNYINQKFICNYKDKNWNASIAYLGHARNTITKNNYNNNYTAAPQLTLNSYYNFYIYKNPCTLKIFNQITKFIPEIYFYPEAIRIHIEPNIHCTIHNNWGNLNIDTKLKFTHYQQKNINYYNITQYMPHHLKNIVNRIVPQFKINSKIILKNNTYVLKKYQYFLESKLQYLYIPYYFQENIGIYDSSIIHIDYNNLFNDSIYSGLDRIAPANHITGNIILHYTNNNHELFYISIGQILNFSQSYLKNINTTRTKYTLIDSILLSGVSHWNIHNRWNAHTEIQYDTQYHILSFGTAILEYIGNNNHILQTHYRYINSQYIKKTSLNSTKSIYPKTITQFGLLTNIPIKDNWKINFTHYHNVKTKKLIDQIISIQYYTSCWNINTSFERKVIGFNKIYKNSVYDNKIKLDVKITYAKTNFKSDPYKTLNKNILPYQYIF